MRFHLCKDTFFHFQEIAFRITVQARSSQDEDNYVETILVKESEKVFMRYVRIHVLM